MSSDGGAWLLTACNDQTSALIEFESGKVAMTFRGHDHVVECAEFVPLNAYPSIRELAQLPMTMHARSNQSGYFVMTGCRDRVIRLFDADGRLLWSFVSANTLTHDCALYGRKNMVKLTFFGSIADNTRKSHREGMRTGYDPSFFILQESSSSRPRTIARSACGI